MNNTTNNTDTKTLNEQRIKGIWELDYINSTERQLSITSKVDNKDIAVAYLPNNKNAPYSAKYICLAVNNFESVLEALKNCREWYDKHGKDYEIGLPNCFIKAKEAINKATL